MSGVSAGWVRCASSQQQLRAHVVVPACPPNLAGVALPRLVPTAFEWIVDPLNRQNGKTDALFVRAHNDLALGLPQGNRKKFSLEVG